MSVAFDLEHQGLDKVTQYNNFVKYMIDQYADGRRVIVIVDEAQNLSAENIEELRVLLNINADKDIVMQLVLVGQPELIETLSRPDMTQFVQRISAYYNLKPLELSETREYILHRMRMAGADRPVFDYDAIYLIHNNSRGVPRIINTLCNLACTYAFAEEKKRITSEIMFEVLKDRNEQGLFGETDNHLPEIERDESGKPLGYMPDSFVSNDAARPVTDNAPKKTARVKKKIVRKNAPPAERDLTEDAPGPSAIQPTAELLRIGAAAEKQMGTRKKKKRVVRRKKKVVRAVDSGGALASNQAEALAITEATQGGEPPDLEPSSSADLSLEDMAETQKEPGFAEKLASFFSSAAGGQSKS